jgi:hypothetical protein
MNAQMADKAPWVRGGNYMLTYTGRHFYPLDPRAEDIAIEDIAHALSMLCRYGGHTPRFYSVAEHSVNVSRLVPDEFALQGLLHDATEAFLVDIPRPVKVALSNYKEIEANLWGVIARKYGVPETMGQPVHDADVAMLFQERDELWPSRPRESDWGMGLSTPIDASGISIIGMRPWGAEIAFLDRFGELQRQSY